MRRETLNECWVSLLKLVLLVIPWLLGFADLGFAQEATPTAVNGSYQFIIGTVNFFLMAFFVYYVIILRPSQLKQDEHGKFLKELKRDDEVVVAGGILGKVSSIQDSYINVEIASGVKLKVKPSAISALESKTQDKANS